MWVVRKRKETKEGERRGGLEGIASHEPGYKGKEVVE